MIYRSGFEEEFEVILHFVICHFSFSHLIWLSERGSVREIAERAEPLNPPNEKWEMRHDKWKIK